jgi:hypothetical protein
VKSQFFLILAVTSLLAACSSKPMPPPADPNPPPAPMVAEPPPPPHPPGPPPEAIGACHDKKLKEKCFFQTPRKDIIRGTCEKAPGPEDVMECRPNPPVNPPKKKK